MERSPTVSGVAFFLDASQCIGCAICADACPDRALIMGSADLRPTWFAALCTGCGICEVECPTAAIRMAQRGSARNGSIAPRAQTRAE